MSPVDFETRVSGLDGARQQPSSPAKTGESFGETLRTQLMNQAGMKLSAHAEKRLVERRVELTPSDGMRLGAAVDRIQEKGADKSLVLMDDLALLVSAKNRVVITAMDFQQARDGVFTNIDSAVIV